ncbi:DUF4397 domain-containing protein [Mucilaginibacter sp. UR6-1]|uniref:DUF4397 domain-containing protein n=1 Tax=Mucilaginibacter sp. UR6-1 TaxID=1435643 RepID=UPI001E326871|nr:DUF4397 domain-containing protein [Mucilaginibacter sp. UR6-1]MCC8408676.1 DUF4397 domain-containing protein [Mucilaginibacter sp. UR6-1]
MKFKVTVIVLAVVAALVSCQDEDVAPTVPPSAAISLVNVSARSFNFFMNGTRLNNTSTIYPDGISGYLEVYSGRQNYQFKNDGSAEVGLALPLSLDSAKSYTLFAAALDTANIILVNDDLTVDTGNVAMIRFVNASPKVNPVALSLNDTTKVNAAAYRSVSDLIRITPGIKKLSVTGGGKTVSDSVTFTRGNAYTIYTKGDPAITGDGGFSADIIQN